MKQITNIAEFVKHLRSSKIILSEGDRRKSTPFRSLDFDCPCGRRHELRKNEYGFLVAPGPLRLEGDPLYSRVSPELYMENGQVLLSCSHLEGLVCVSVERTILRQSTNTLFFIKYETLNAASSGFGLLYETSDDIVDFNIIGQSRVRYPTQMLTSRIEMEEQILLEPSENILRSRQFFENLKDVTFSCPCGEEHGMGGIREDYSLVQWGRKIVTVPILVVVKDLGGLEWKSVLYRCSERYTMLQWRPSHPALWSAKIDLISHGVQNDSKLPDPIFNIFSTHTDAVNISVL